MQKMFNLKKKLIPAMCKCMVSMATNNAIIKIGGVTTKSFISQLLLSLDYKTWYQIQAMAYACYHMVRYTNYLICIFMHINENVKKCGKIVTNIHKLTHFRPKPSWMYVIISYMIQFDKLFYPVVLYKNYLISIVMNIHVNLKNDGKIIGK